MKINVYLCIIKQMQNNCKDKVNQSWELIKQQRYGNHCKENEECSEEESYSVPPQVWVFGFLSVQY